MKWTETLVGIRRERRFFAVDLPRIYIFKSLSIELNIFHVPNIIDFYAVNTSML